MSLPTPAAMSGAQAPELLSKVGFKKSKIGSGDKEVGYQIKESSLSSLMGSAFLCFLVMGLMVVSMVFDIHFEKKTLHHQMRVEEHWGSAKLQQVQMELWSQYHQDIQESHEAQALLKNLNDSIGSLQGKLKLAVGELSAELNLNPLKAEKFADKLFHLVADTQQDTVKHAKHLVDHLVAAGKKSIKLEKHVDREILKEAKDEKKKEEQDTKDGMHIAADIHTEANEAAAHDKGLAPGSKEEKEGFQEDPLKEMITGFFFTFHDFEREFKGEARKKMVDGNPVYESIKLLYAKVKGPEAMGEEEVQVELDKIDLSAVGAALGSGRVLPVMDIVEEIALIPKVPFDKLEKLEKTWKKGELDSVEVFEQLQEMHEKNLVPAGWLQQGVAQEEKEDEMDEDREETMETE